MKFKTSLKSTQSLIDLTPLVDIIFLLLIFFIVTSDILPLKSLNIETPFINKDSNPLTTQLLLVMDAQNVLYLGSKKSIVDFDSLKASLEEEIKEIKDRYNGIEPTLVLSIDRRVEYGLFLKLFSIAQETSPHLRLVYQSETEWSG
jgi:biopolymer transport protein ExbD